MRKWVIAITAAAIIMANGNAASAESVITPKKVILKVNNTGMFVDEATTSTLLDPQLYATPEIRNNRVMIPIASVIKEFGGSSSWSAKDKKVSLTLGNNNVVLYLNKTNAYVNGVSKTLDSTPITSSEGRTLVPLRFVSDNLGITLIWDSKNQIIALYRGEFDAYPNDYSNYFISMSDSNSNNNSTPDTTPNSKPIDQNGVQISVGDRISNGFFYGEVRKVDGGRILVYWDSKNDLYISDEDTDYWAMLSGVKYLSSSWVNASTLTVES
ncbi:hypothetical protein H1230_09500 [Paenibacillus sp. 19GGS1-52]|uniref:stalk domain-containing protein n=1 Tax=Paenibacillus sp. 19GGS1-52 TaxID=2758563 RepID=UPI001EFB5B6F|nr:stalk domain-containing protein [Paenibacillus sp. 19GGS1-52]ULO08976.1 hypothetical protein H1230_09500 [Paenibacillus sp. 19GGS1-52]